MKKGAVIFGSLLVLIFAALAIVVTVAISKAPSRFVSPSDEREWARAEFDRLFITSTGSLPLLPSDPPAVRKMTEKKNKVEFVFDSISRDKRELTRFGNRIDTPPGDTAAILPDGNTLRFLGVATYFPEKLHERFLNGNVELVWHNPATLEPLDDSTARERNLESTSRLDLSERAIVLAFDLSEPDLPHRWQSINTRNSDTLCRVHSSSSSQTRENVRYCALELNLYHQSAMDLLISISHGKPETQTVDFASLPLNKPVFFDSGNVQLSVPFRSDGNQNSSSHSHGGPSGKRDTIGFGWTKSSSYRKSFAIIDCWPPAQGSQFEWRTTSGDKNNDYWRGNFGNDGVSSIDFITKLAETGPSEIRHFPDVTHVAFHLDAIPGLPKLKNLFEVNSGPIRFKYGSDARNFLESATQTRVTWHGKVWPDSSLPIEFENITPAELIAKAETLNGIQLHVDSDAQKIEEWKPKPLLERLSDWFKNLF